MKKTDLYILLGMLACLLLGELAMVVRSEALVYVATYVGVSSLIPMWIDTWKKQQL